MPEKIRHKNITSAARTGIARRKNKSQHRCQESGIQQQETAAVISHSIFALTLPCKKAFEVAEKEISPFHAPVSDIIGDLFDAVNKVLKLKGLSPVVLRYDGDDKTKMQIVLTLFKDHILPNGYDFNIEKDEYQYYFVIYKEAEFSQHWHSFHIKPVLEYLKKKPYVLTGAFLNVISKLIQHCEFNTWYGDYYPYWMIVEDQDSFEDYISNNYESIDEDDIAESSLWHQLRGEYLQGDPIRIKEEIQKANWSIDRIKNVLKNYRKTPFIKWMWMAIDVIEDGQCIGNYSYQEYWENNEDGALRLSDQVTILWDEDKLFLMGCDYMDNDASNFGVETAFVCFPVSKNNRSLYLDKLPIAEKWPGKIDALYQSFHSLPFVNKHNK